MAFLFGQGYFLNPIFSACWFPNLFSCKNVEGNDHCKFIAKFDKMKQMWLNYYETNRNYEEKNVIHVQCSYCPTCSVPKWRNANGWTWGSLWLKMSYSSSFGWLFGLFLFRYWTWRGGGKKNPAKKTCTKKWKIL